MDPTLLHKQLGDYYYSINPELALQNYIFSKGDVDFSFDIDILICELMLKLNYYKDIKTLQTIKNQIEMFIKNCICYQQQLDQNYFVYYIILSYITNTKFDISKFYIIDKDLKKYNFSILSEALDKKNIEIFDKFYKCFEPKSNKYVSDMLSILKMYIEKK